MPDLRNKVSILELRGEGGDRQSGRRSPAGSLRAGRLKCPIAKRKRTRALLRRLYDGFRADDAAKRVPPAQQRLESADGSACRPGNRQEFEEEFVVLEPACHIALGLRPLPGGVGQRFRVEGVAIAAHRLRLVERQVRTLQHVARCRIASLDEGDAYAAAGCDPCIAKIERRFEQCLYPHCEYFRFDL
ncbi:hypothetical protein D9M68_588060 [compost metagenome]